MVADIIQKHALIVTIAVVFFNLAAGPALASKPPAPAGAIGHVVYENGSLSLTAHSVSLITLLQEIAEATNIRIVTASRIAGDQIIEADIRNKSLREVLHALLNGHSYLVHYNSTPSQNRLHLIAGSALTPGGGPPPASAEGSLPATLAAPAASHSQKKFSPALKDTSVTRSFPKKIVRQTSFPAVDKEVQWSTAQNGGPGRMPVSRAPGAGDGTISSANVNEGANPKGLDTIAEDPALLEQAALEKNWKREDFLRHTIDLLSEKIKSGLSDQHYELWIQRKDKRYITHDRELLENYERELDTLLKKS